MVKKSTWVVVIIFAVVVVGFLLIEKYPVGPLKATSTPTLQPSVFSEVPFDQVVKVDVIGLSDVSFQLELIGDTWILTEDRSKTLSQRNVFQLLSTLLSIESQSSIDPTTPMEALGLVQPIIKYKLVMRSGSEHVFSIGGLTPTSSGYYAQFDQNAPVIINSNTVMELSQLSYPESLLAETPTPSTLDVVVTPTP